MPRTPCRPPRSRSSSCSSHPISAPHRRRPAHKGHIPRRPPYPLPPQWEQWPPFRQRGGSMPGRLQRGRTKPCPQYPSVPGNIPRERSRRYPCPRDEVWGEPPRRSHPRIGKASRGSEEIPCPPEVPSPRPKPPSRRVPPSSLRERCLQIAPRVSPLWGRSLKPSREYNKSPCLERRCKTPRTLGRRSACPCNRHGSAYRDNVP